MSRAAQEFRAEIQRAGLTPPDEVIADGKLHRFPTNGRRGDDSGWYVLHADGIPAGAFGDWRSGISSTWRADVDRPLTPDEEAAARRRFAELRKKAEAQRQARAERAAALAAEIWKAARPAGEDHPYLKRKGVRPTDTLREMSADELAERLGYAPQARGEALQGRVLIVPVRVGGKLSTLELIDERGRKAALAGGIKRGGYWATGPLPDVGRIVLAEGVATALSIAEALGEPVAAALSVGNLQAAGEAIREARPHAEIVIAADLGDDGKPHPDAIKAAEALRCRLAAPAFAGDPPSGGDFNDVHQVRGLEAVRACIEAAEAPVKVEPKPGQKNAPEGEHALDVRLIRGSDVRVEPVQWLWPGWLAAGKVHILGGAPGTGKTTIAMGLAAAQTTGGRWPDGTRSTAGNVVIWSGEDDPGDTLIPRLALSGADLSRVYFVGDVREGNERRAFDPARDVEPLRRRLAEIGDVKLLIVDPIVSAVAGDSHKNAETRRGLQPLVDLAASMRCALLGITHFSKGTAGREPLERITGSLAFGALARIVLVAAKHKEEGADGRTVRIFCRAKSNLGPDEGGFEYDLHQGEMKTHPGVFATFVQWGAPVEGAARDLLAQAEATEGDERSELEDAKRFLADLLADGPLPSKTVKAEADGAGYSWATIRRAQKALGVEAVKEGGYFGGRQQWRWRLPAIEDAQDAQRERLQDESLKMLKDSEDAHHKNVGTFRKFEHLQGKPPGGDDLDATPEGAQDSIRRSTKNAEHLNGGMSILRAHEWEDGGDVL
jgi:putative DNA primase/helicase